MVARATAFLACVLLLGWAAFRMLVDDEVRRVLAVHVIDKANHLVDMFEASPQNGQIHQSGEVEPGAFENLAVMANAIHVSSIYFLDNAGSQIGRLHTADLGSTIDHSDNGMHPKPEEIHTSDHHVLDHADGHGHVSLERHRILASEPFFDAAALRPLTSGQNPNVVSVNALRGADGALVNYAMVALPVQSTEDSQIRFIGFVMDVSHIHAAYEKGVTHFGMLFVICGIVLFGVPAFAFWLQKRLAERSSQAAKYLSLHDTLTGLLNRSAFVAEAKKWLEADELGYVAYIDVDRFKLINDTYGHSVGDAFLCHLANLLKESCRSEGLFARLGGDEFALALPKLNEAQGQAMIRGIVDAAAKEVELNGVTISGSISVGIARQSPNVSLDGLLQRADTALYFAKSHGRNKAAFFTDEMGSAARRRRMLEARLRHACSNNEFEIHYQPLVDAKTLETLGYEALLRLSDLNGDPISPAEFIPVAEEAGLIEEIGAWVLDRATEQISALDDYSSVSINLSSEQFRSGKLVQLVSTALEKSGLSPDRLELEITESILLDRDVGTEFQIDALKEMGISIAMDDFGTGFSSLSTLWKFGFDRIKIDKSFVKALEETPERSRQLIDAIVLLGGRMGISITAEGVETEQQWDLLTAMGCDILQGFLLGKPEQIGVAEIRGLRRTAS